MPNHTFVERIRYASGRTDEERGHWSWSGHSLDLGPLWIPMEFAPPSIQEVDKYAAPGEGKFTEPSFHIVPVERYFGTTYLTIFEDAGISFQMQRRIR